MGELGAVGLRRWPFAVDFGATFGAELLELSVERLPVGADSGVSEVRSYLSRPKRWFPERSTPLISKTDEAAPLHGDFSATSRDTFMAGEKAVE
jgi:hypothetical protein